MSQALVDFAVTRLPICHNLRENIRLVRKLKPLQASFME